MGERVLEKPVDESDARSMLRELSGKTHQVMTGFTVASVNTTVLRNVTRLIKTDVEFKELSEPEISRYVATGEPMDKAGAYAAQGVAGYLIRRIVGSYTNVIGLPVAELIDIALMPLIITAQALLGVRVVRGLFGNPMQIRGFGHLVAAQLAPIALLVSSR